MILDWLRHHNCLLLTCLGSSDTSKDWDNFKHFQGHIRVKNVGWDMLSQGRESSLRGSNKKWCNQDLGSYVPPKSISIMFGSGNFYHKEFTFVADFTNKRLESVSPQVACYPWHKLGQRIRCCHVLHQLAHKTTPAGSNEPLWGTYSKLHTYQTQDLSHLLPTSLVIVQLSHRFFGIHCTCSWKVECTQDDLC